MKKLYFTVFCIVVLYYLNLRYQDYCNWPITYFTDQKMQIVIEKPFDMANGEFVNKLIKFSEIAKLNITYEWMEECGDYVRMNYYTTDEIKGINELNYLYEIHIFDFKNIVNCNINACNYYIDFDNSNEFICLLENENIAYKEIKGMELIPQYVTYSSMFLPCIILIVSFISLVISKEKEFAVKAMSGYSIYLIIKEFILELLVKMGLACCVCILIFSFVLYVKFPVSAGNFFHIFFGGKYCGIAGGI